MVESSDKTWSTREGNGKPLKHFCLENPMKVLLLLLLLSCFSRVRLCATPWTAAYQAPLSLGFSRQEHWSGLPFPSPMRESEIAQSCPTFRHPMDYSLAGSSVHGIFQARVLECHFLLQGIFLTQGLNLGLPHCRQTLYCLGHQGS